MEKGNRAGDVDAVRQQLDLGTDINARDRYGQTALMLAARGGQQEVVHTLIANGADLNVTAKYGLSALMLARSSPDTRPLRECSHGLEQTYR